MRRSKAVLPALAVFAAVAGACKVDHDVVVATVEFDATSRAECAQLKVTATGQAPTLGPVTARDHDSYNTAIFRGGLPGSITLQAFGFAGAACASGSPAETDSIERTAVAPANFLPSAPNAVTVRLVPELCGNGQDDDFDSAADCADPDCAANPCGANPCLQGQVCTAGACGGGAPLTCTPPGECFTGSCQADAGCTFATRSGSCDGGTCQLDGGCAAPAGSFLYSPSNFIPSVIVPIGITTINCAATLDTTTLTPGFCSVSGPYSVSTVTMEGGAEAALLSVGALVINGGGGLTVSGSRPLIIAAYGDATINGYVRASAQAFSSGAGSNPASCPGIGGDGAGNNQGGGGGGGGGFGTAGAAGGPGKSTAIGGTPGAAFPGDGLLTPLLAGCPGGRSLIGTGNCTANVLGGGGGGAVQLSASGQLTINGSVTAAGGGGTGGATDGCGGGGGGSGGGILLEGTTIQIGNSAAVAAQGGGGGGGHGGGGAAQSGEDGHSAPGAVASGGRGGMDVTGGDGAVQGTPAIAGADGSSNGGGGGGGGGLGQTRLNATVSCTIPAPLSARFSPQPTSNGATGCP